MRRRRKKSWSKKVAHYIAQEMRSNAHKKRKRPWNQVVAIGFARARKAGVPIPTGGGHGRELAAFGRRGQHNRGQGVSAKYVGMGEGGLWATTREGRKRK